MTIRLGLQIPPCLAVSPGDVRATMLGTKVVSVKRHGRVPKYIHGEKQPTSDASGAVALLPLRRIPGPVATPRVCELPRLSLHPRNNHWMVIGDTAYKRRRDADGS